MEVSEAMTDPITPAISLTGTYTPTVVLWQDYNGVDVGSLATSAYTGLAVLMIIAAMVLGFTLAIVVFK